MPPTPAQRRAARAVVIALSTGFALLAPFAAVQLMRVDGFVTAILTIVFVTDLATAVLLFSQFSIVRSRALLVLAAGYLFSALIVVPHALTFPGAFTPGGLLGAGLQSSAWLYLVWHGAFPLVAIGYTWLKESPKDALETSPAPAICWAVIVVLSLVWTFTWAVTRGHEFIPILLNDEVGFSSLAQLLPGLVALLCVLALALLWTRRRSVLDLWLMVALCAAVAELAVGSVFVMGRFNLTYYCGRALSVVVSTTVLTMLVAETIKLYALLSRANDTLQRERESTRINLEAGLAWISHEVRQPLTAIAAKGSAARRFLARAPAETEKTQQLLGEIVDASFRANDAFVRVADLLRNGGHEQRPVDVNALAVEVLRLVRGELKDAGVEASMQLASGLPPLVGHEGQLQEAVLSLVRNAIEALALLEDKSRVLRVRTEREGPGSIAVSVEDSGLGINPAAMHRLFHPFVTTKANGMGLGLAVCRAIVERHGGTVSAFSEPEGARFKIVLPVRQPA